MNTVVNVRPYIEFHNLSNGVNKMVVALKKLIAEAEARIVAELEFAKKDTVFSTSCSFLIIYLREVI